MRSEGDAIDASLDETFRIGKEANIPVEIWHLKVAGKTNWHKMPEVVAKINAARREGRRCDRRHLRVSRVVQ